MPQVTIDRPVETSGIGLHTAAPCRLRLLPAPPDTGIVFRRTDLDNFPVEAHVRNVARVSYATSLMKRGVLISTTEHLLAALYSSGIDNVFVDLDNLEVPLLDGSAKPFLDMLDAAGLRRLRRRRRYIEVLRPLEFVDGDRRLAISPGTDFLVHCFVDFGHPVAGPQEISLRVDADSFRRELAPARTFGFTRDFEALRRVGLIRGGSMENAIVLDGASVLNGPLRFPDEFVRHKALDLIGDLALVGLPLRARVEAHKAGHAAHVALVTRLLSDPSYWRLSTSVSAPQSAAVPRTSRPAAQQAGSRHPLDAEEIASATASSD